MFAFTLISYRQRFQPRAHGSVFIGYPMGMKAYKLLDLETKHIYNSRDVIFHEDIYPFQHSTNQPNHNLFIIHTLPKPAAPIVDPSIQQSQISQNDQNNLPDEPPPVSQNQRPTNKNTF